MSAAEFGGRLLKEVEVVSLNELLSQLVTAHPENISKELGVPRIDRLLRSDAYDAIARHQNARRDAITANEGTSRTSKPIVEVTSTSPGSGKTHFLYLVSSFLLLQSHRHCTQGNDNGGEAVVVVDVDGRFDTTRLASIMRVHLDDNPEQSLSLEQPDNLTEDSRTDASKEANPGQADEPLRVCPQDEIIQRALQHVHVFRPQSLKALVSTLKALVPYLTDTSVHLSSNRRLGALMLDGVSSFYWQHREDEEATRLRKIDGLIGLDRAMEPPQYNQLLRELRKLQLEFRCRIIYTTQSHQKFIERNQSATRSFDLNTNRSNLRPLLPVSWLTYPTARICLQQARIARFATGMGVKEAWADRAVRERAVRRGLYTASTIDADGAGRQAFELVIDADSIRIRDEQVQPSPSQPI